MVFIRKAPDIRSSEITPRSLYMSRRDMVLGSAAAGIGSLLLPEAASAARLKAIKSRYSTDENKTELKDVITYNNFYEFGTDKSDPARYAHTMKTDPWSVKIDGFVGKPGSYALEDILKNVTLEERIYRLRCVEAWSMVVPWIGFPLADLLKRVEPGSNAKYVAFETLVRPSEMRGQRGQFQALKWPYKEGLRLDEAMHPLTILAVGLYGETMPNQNGAPIRLVVPWKYGFKSIKSIVRISLTDKQPPTSWNEALGREYGFYSNVNPEVDHPRWSQKKERRIGEGWGLFAERRPTLKFNGYGEHVAKLYDGMDLRTHY